MLHPDRVISYVFAFTDYSAFGLKTKVIVSWKKFYCLEM